MSVIIRPADLEADALAIFDGAKDFIFRMAGAEFLPQTDVDLIRELGRVLSIPGVELTVAEHESRIVGGIGMFYGPFLWDARRLAAEELFWWGATDAPASAALRLIRAVREQVRERGAIATFKRLTSSPDKLDRVYRKLGLIPMETSYMGTF